MSSLTVLSWILLVITDDSYLSLSDDLFLKILHAHTRVTCIRNFCIPRSFAAFDNLSRYLDFYWSLTFISHTDPTIPSNDTICGTYVGHPQGQLQSIYYHGHFGAPTLQEGDRIQQIIQPYTLDDSYGLKIQLYHVRTTTALNLYMMTVTGAQLIWMLRIISVQCVK